MIQRNCHAMKETVTDSQRHSVREIITVSHCHCERDNHFNNNNNDFISIALFHVKHAQLR